MEALKTQDEVSATLQTSASGAEKLGMEGIYTFRKYVPKEGLRNEVIVLRKLADKLNTEWFGLYARLFSKVKRRIAGLQEAVDSMMVFEEEFTFENTVMTEGKNLALDTILSGSAYTVVGPFLGLISAVSYTAITSGDVIAQLAGTNGWREAGATNAPTYTAPRKTAVFSAAAAGVKALSANLSFAITSGTNVVIKGAFLVYGTGALSTIDNTAGKLLSAGTFTGGDKTVSNGDTLTVSYQLSA